MLTLPLARVLDLSDIPNQVFGELTRDSADQVFGEYGP